MSVADQERALELEEKILRLKETVTWHGLQRMELDRRIKNATHELSLLNRKQNGLSVSDHAVVRYLEREYNMDICSIRDEIRDRIQEGQTEKEQWLAGLAGQEHSG